MESRVPGIVDNPTRKFSFLFVPVISIVYLLFAYYTTGIRSDHIFLVSLVNACYFLASFTKRLITGLAIMMLYWIIFDSMKLYPNWQFNHVDILPLYNLEKYLFGVNEGTTSLTPNEYFLLNHNSFLDVMSGIFYLSWVPLPLIFSFYLYSRDKNMFLRFCMAFFFVNIIGFVIYYLHPAAPPWYVEKFGYELDTNTKSYAAGLLRFDNFFNIHLFEGMYSKGSNVFAAMPSLHASYPLIGLIYATIKRNRFFQIVFGIFMPGICFSAIYLSHHYILDVLAGIACGITGVLIFEKIILKKKWFRNFLALYEKEITAK
jgi:membrane-associated phospholipid phosphatase